MRRRKLTVSLSVSLGPKRKRDAGHHVVPDSTTIDYSDREALAITASQVVDRLMLLDPDDHDAELHEMFEAGWPTLAAQNS